MSRYPDSPIPLAPYPFRSNRPFVSGGPEWAPQDRGLTRFGLGEADLSYNCLADWSEIKTLYDFFESVGGSAGRFTFADFNGWDTGGVAWSGLYVAKGNGVAVTWDLPTFGIVASPAPVVYENGVSKTSDVQGAGGFPNAALNYHIYLGTGTDGVDSITAQATPAASVIVTIDATCRRAFRRAKFLNAKNPFTWDPPEMSTQGPVTIVEVRR